MCPTRRCASSLLKRLRPSSLTGLLSLPSSYSARFVEGGILPPLALRFDDMASDSMRALLIIVGSCRRRALMNQLEIWSVQPSR